MAEQVIHFIAILRDKKTGELTCTDGRIAGEDVMARLTSVLNTYERSDGWGELVSFSHSIER